MHGNQSTPMIPVGERILGRVINSAGEPIDGKGSLKDVLHLPLSSLVSTSEPGEQRSLDSMFETGIKAVDLLAPIVRQGVTGLFAGIGTGKLVTLAEMMHTLLTHYSKHFIVCLGMDEGTYETNELVDPMMREVAPQDKIVLVFEQMSNSPEVSQHLLEAGLTIATHYAGQGYEVMLVADKNVTVRGNLLHRPELKRVAAEESINTILLGSVEDFLQCEESGILSNLDSWILFDRELAKQRLYPAVDRLVSGSRLLDNRLVSPEHLQVAQQVRALLQRYYSVREATKTQNMANLSLEDHQVLKRGERIEQFFTQPYFVAEAYTDIPGEYVKLEDTIQNFKELLEGRYDEVPEKAFYFVGTVDQALAKARHMNTTDKQ